MGAAKSLSSDSSVYREGFQLKFHSHLRMHVCTLHKQSMVFSALRHNDFALMEHISKQIKDSEDIDFENIYGDTALTLACRMGKLNFIELLVQHSADINKETSNGRTGGWVGELSTFGPVHELLFPISLSLCSFVMRFHFIFPNIHYHMQHLSRLSRRRLRTYRSSSTCSRTAVW